MRKTLRRVFLGLGLIGLFVWHYVYTWMISRDCAAAGTPPEDCAFILPWELDFQQSVLMLMVPGFIATIPFFLAFLVGGEPMRRPIPPTKPKQNGED